jgi:hypothetical protein
LTVDVARPVSDLFPVPEVADGGTEGADHGPFGIPQLVLVDMTSEYPVLACAGGCGVDVFKLMNRVRLPEIDVVRGRSEVLGDDAGDFRGCAVLAGCRDEDSDGGFPREFRMVTGSSCLRIGPVMSRTDNDHCAPDAGREPGTTLTRP